MNLIEINLLPSELRPRKKISISMPHINLLPVIIWAVLSLFFIQLILVAVVRYQKHELDKYNKRWLDMTSSNAKLTELKTEIKDVTEKVGKIEGLFKRRFLWARKLNQLSDVLSEGIWLEEISLDIKSETRAPPVNVKGAKPKKVLSYSLVMKGSAVSREEEETAVIGKFMKTLKEDKSFFSDFQDIELGSIQSDKLGERDIMHFTITCRFKEAAIQ